MPSAARYLRNSAVLAKIEATYGTDSVPTGPANAILCGQPTITPLDATNLDRELVRPYFGASEQLVGPANVKLEFPVELAGSGTAGTPPAFGPLLRMCGMAELITASNRVEYSPVSSGFESGSLYYYDDGVRHILTGVRGSVALDLSLSAIPRLLFKLMGLDGGVATASLPSATLTGFKTPLPVSDANTGDTTFGATYTTGSLSGGTAYPSRGLQIDIGNAVNHMPMLGGESVEITNRVITGNLDLDLTAAQEVAFATTVKGNGTQGFGIQHGTTAGNIVVLHGPAVQVLDWSKKEWNGKRLQGYGLRFVPVSGNDEFRLCFK